MRTGRQPVDKLARMGKPTGQDAIWAAIRALSSAGEGFTRSDILAHLAIAQGRAAASRDTVRDYLARLGAAGIVGQVGGGTVEPGKGFVAAIYQLVTDLGPETPRIRPDGTVVLQGAAREAMWRTMKILGQFTANDLVKLGSTEEVAIGTEDTRYYLKMLVHAGYVMVIDRPARTAIPTTYRLLPSRKTGPKAPQVQRQHRVFDPNLGKVVWAGEPEVVE